MDNPPQHQSGALLNRHVVHFCSGVDKDGTYEIVGAYRSEPKIEFRGVVSEIHYGSFIIRPDGNRITSMEGHYWTDRNTKGAISYSERSMESADSFQSAKALKAVS